MDSGNEVIIFEENFASATNNGINGNYEEVILVAPPSSNASTTNAGEQQQQQNMKTRSKGTENASATTAVTTSGGASAVAAEDASSTKSKLRSTRTDKTASVASSEASGDKKEAPKKPPPAVITAAAKKAMDNTPTKRKAAATTTGSANGEDDSGINSRSSSVSNEDATYSSRMRTRSKTAEALSSSTPASTKKGASRMPLSTYDFDEDISILDDYPSTSGSSLKRKAVYVEEMEEPAEPEVEPPPKRVALQNAGLGLVNALLYPLRAIRGRVSSVASQTEASKGEANINDAASQTHVSKVKDDDPEKENVASQTDINGPSQTAAIDKASSSTCRVM